MQELISAAKGKSLTIGIFSRPDFGKTTLLLQMANMLSSKRICFFSLGMSECLLRNRLGEMNIDQNKYVICDKPDATEETINDFVSPQKGIDVIAIDYLQLITDENTRRNLNNISKKFNIPILYSSQLRRDAGDEQPGRRPTIVDVEKVVDAPKSDVILSIWRPHECDRGIGHATAYNIQNQTEISILKSSIVDERIIPAHFNEKNRYFSF